jgi:hypothetical protein
VWVTICDHFEPRWARADETIARERVRAWREAWPEIARRHEDSSGRPPQYGFFYPQEEYAPELLEPLAEINREGLGDVEVHIHHDGDGEQSFVERVSRFIETLAGTHGLLRRHHGKLTFGFIHGNWALDNARPDGRWCGLNNEITLLRDLGCYADFTLPSAPDPSQAGPVNVIYDVTDDPRRPRSHSRGHPVRPGAPRRDLTLITGPLGLSLDRTRGWRPSLENGELAHYRPASPDRVQNWHSWSPRIGEDQFIKLYTHGAQEANSHYLLGGGLDRVFDDLKRSCADRSIELRFVTAWEMWNVIEALRKSTHCDLEATCWASR